MYYSQSEVAKLLKENGPITICDGTEMPHLPFFGQLFLSWLKFNGLTTSIEDKLYERENFDLSKYKVIAFSTNGEENRRKSFEKIIKSFSPANLKVIVIGNEVSYLRIKDLTEKLGIKVVVFDYYKPMIFYSKMKRDVGDMVEISLNEMWAMDVLPEMFFDPKEKWG